MSRRVALEAARLPPDGGRAVLRIDGHCVALFHVSGKYYAIADGCPHQGASLAGGKLDGPYVQCQAHGLRFHLATGSLANVPQMKVAVYPITIEADGVYLTLPDEDH
jgi:nitrite reductase/ring-hydroxylating ferredoxin subunit